MGITLGSSNSAPTNQLGGGVDLARPATPVGQIQGGGVSLVKGGKVDITKGNPGLDTITVGLGWDVNQNGQSYDLDAQAFLLGADKRAVSPAHVIFYNQKVSPDGAVTHHGDNLTGDGEGDDETLSIKLAQVSSQVERIVFTVTIHDAVAKRQNFGQVNNAYIRILNQATGAQLARFDLSEDHSTSISLIVGEVYRHNGEWKFGAVEQGVNVDLSGLFAQYGIN